MFDFSLKNINTFFSIGSHLPVVFAIFSDDGKTYPAKVLRILKPHDLRTRVKYDVMFLGM